jgi:hypothetical protein
MSVMTIPMTAMTTPTRVKMASLDHDEAEPVVGGKAELGTGTGAAWVAMLYTKQPRPRLDGGVNMSRRGLLVENVSRRFWHEKRDDVNLN